MKFKRFLSTHIFLALIFFAGPPVMANPLAFPPNNQYTSVGGVNFSYDLNGNLTSDGTLTLAYDSESRLISARKGANTASYTYDPFGRRLTRTLNGTTTRYLYDGDQLITETDAAGALTAKFLYGPGIDEPLRMERSGINSYYHADGLGSPVALTDPSGNITERYAYDIYGTPRIMDPDGNERTISAFGNNLLFTGREWDPETGLYHYRARGYHPGIGRFLQRDPEATDFNLYRYVLNSPVNWLDPWGTDIFSPQPPPVNIRGYLGPRFIPFSIDAPLPYQEGLSDWVPILYNPPVGPDLLPGPTLGTPAYDKKIKKGNLTDQLPNISNARRPEKEESKGRRSIGERIRDIIKNPNRWVKIGEKRDPRQPRGGESIRELWRNKETGELLERHRKTPDPRGRHPHYGPPENF